MDVHVSPFVKPQDIGGLLTKAGFILLTIVRDPVTVLLRRRIDTRQLGAPVWKGGCYL